MIRFWAVVWLTVFTGSAMADYAQFVKQKRMEAAKEMISAVELGYVDITEEQAKYLKAVARHIFKSNGEFLFDMPESVVLSRYEHQVGFQGGRFISYCADDEDSDVSEGVTAETLDGLCQIAKS